MIGMSVPHLSLPQHECDSGGDLLNVGCNPMTNLLIK